jgi:hypothetical protein
VLDIICTLSIIRDGVSLPNSLLSHIYLPIAKDVFMLFRIILFTALTLGILRPAEALRFHVNPTTGDNRRSVQSAQDTSTVFKTITHALRIAHLVTEGRPHVIELASGTYSPSTGESFPLNISQTGIYVKTNGQTIFDAESKSNFFNITAPTSDFTIQGIDFLNGQAAKGGVAYCNTCSLRVVDNRFFKNRSTQGGHVIYTEKGHLKFYKNIVRDSGNGPDTLAVIELRNTFTDTTVRDEIRNNTFYRNPSPNIWTSSPRTYISSNIFFDPQRAAIRDASASASPILDHNLFWEAEILYVSDKGDSVNINRSVRDTLSFSKAGISLPIFMTSTPDVRTLKFRGDTLSLANLNVRIPSFVTNHPDTLVKVGEAHQYLIEVSGTTSQYQFKSLTLPTNARLDSVSSIPRLLIWNTTLNDTASHPISLQITAPSGQIDTLSYNLDVLTSQNFPDTTGFLAVRDSSGRFAGMVKEVTTIEVPHKANENYSFDIQVQGNKSSYVFTPLAIPSGVSSSQVSSQGLIDWSPTLADTGRSNVSVEINDPIGNIDTLTYNIFVFKPEVFPDTSLSATIITTTLIPDTTAAITALNAITASFSIAVTASVASGSDTLTAGHGNLYLNPAFLDTTVNRFELIETPSSPAIDTGTQFVSLRDAGGNNRNDIGNFGGPNNGGPPQPDTTSFSEIKITTLPDSVVTEGQVFTYNPVLSPTANIELVDLIPNIPGTTIPPITTFGFERPFTWTPTLADTGSYLIGVKVFTASGSGRQYFPLRVRALNEIPILTGQADTTALEDELYSYTIQASDPNGDTLSYTLVTGPDSMSVNATSGLVQWTPAQSNVGSHSISIRIDDGKNGTNLHNYTLVVSNTNDAPLISSTPDSTASEDALFTYTVLASDPDPADTLSYALTTAPTGSSIDSVGVLRWTPTQAQVDTQQVAVKVTDRNSATATQSFTVIVTAVDDTPIIAATPDTSALEDSNYSLNLQASDEEGGTLTYALSQGPAGMAVDSTGALTWTPSGTDIGSHPIVVTASDPAGQAATLSFSLVVNAVNDAPKISTQTPTDALVRNTPGNAVSFSVSASDEEGDALSYSWLVNDTLQTGSADTTFTYTPTVARRDSVTVQIADASDTTRFTWRVDGRQIPRIALGGAGIDFGSVAIGDTARSEIIVSNAGETALTISALQVGDLHFAAVFAAISIDPNQSTTLALSYAPTARGTSADTIRFSSDDPDNAALSIPVVGLDIDNATGDQTSGQANIQAGDVLSIAIYAQKTVSLQRYQMRFTFNPGLFSFSSFAAQSDSETSLLASQGASVVVLSAIESDSIAVLDADISTGGISGNGLLGIATFKADSSAASGQTHITLQRALLKSQDVATADTLGKGLSVSINLRPALLGDFDFDANVDFNDFFFFADNFGRADFDPATDLNTDGAVTFDDFFIFADNFGQTALAKLIVGEGAQTAPLRLGLVDSQPDQISLTPYWQGEAATRGYVLSLDFDPNVLHFSQYLPREGEAPLPWVVESTPGHLTLAAGLAHAQADFSGEDLGQFVFSRLAPHQTQIRPTAALSFDGDHVETLLPPPALDLQALPQTYALFPAHPNPFNPETTVPFYLPGTVRLSLTVYDLLGRPVRTLVDGPMQAGFHSLTWRGRDDAGRSVASGLYLIEMKAPQWRQIRKVMLLK